MKLCMGCMREMDDHLTICPHCGFDETGFHQESYYLDPGTIISGRYIVGRVLNYGGHTVSYMGMDAEKNQKVIVKEYLPSDFSTRSEGEKEVTIYSGDGQEQFEQGLTNFLNEANRIQHLKNADGIAKIYDCVSENETGYVISEYIEGNTLKEIFETGKRYSSKEATDFICKILQGLADVHRMNIIHCDISPETIMVTDSGEIKLTDFGATRYVTTANSKSLSIILKRGYAPEEQYRSKGVRGPWTDVYALAAVMYQMLTGKVPQESVERALSDDLKEPSKLGVAIPKTIENALMNALNIYQKDRTQSAEEFLKELRSSDVKRKKVKQKKNKTGKMLLWTKTLVAAMVCAVAVGGVYLYKHGKTEESSLNSETLQMVDLTGKTEEDVNKIVENLKKKGVEISLGDSQYKFSCEEEKANTVAEQSIQAGTVLSSEKKTEGSSESSSESEQKVLTLTYYRSDTLYYKELADKNAYQIAQELGVNITDLEHFETKEETDDNKNYFDVISLKNKENDKVIYPEDLANSKDEIKVNQLKITYYAGDFFYWDKLPDFTQYKKVDEIPQQKTYRYDGNEKTPKETGKTKQINELIKKEYYTFDSKNYEEGVIFDQTVTAGEEYNQSTDMDVPLEIKAIKKCFETKGKTGKKLVDEINSGGLPVRLQVKDEEGKEYTFGTSEYNKAMERDVLRVDILDENNETMKEPKPFTKDEVENEQRKIIIILKAKPKPTPTSTPTPIPIPSNGGNSNGGNSKSGNSKSGKQNIPL